MSLRVVVITRDEPFFTPDYLAPLMESPNANVVGLFINSQSSPYLNFPDMLVIVSVFGAMKLALWFLLSKIPGGLKLAGFHGERSVKRLAKQKGIRVIRGLSVNDAYFVELLQQMNPDVIASIANHQQLPPAVLSTARIAALNSHGSYLPSYRGILTGFWMLLHGETQGGVTIHEMTSDVDAGRILLQRQIPVDSGETVFSYYRKVAREGGRLWAEAMAVLARGARPCVPNQPENDHLYLKPSRQDLRLFRIRGKRFI